MSNYIIDDIKTCSKQDYSIICKVFINTNVYANFIISDFLSNTISKHLCGNSLIF